MLVQAAEYAMMLGANVPPAGVVRVILEEKQRRKGNLSALCLERVRYCSRVAGHTILLSPLGGRRSCVLLRKQLVHRRYAMSKEKGSVNKENVQKLIDALKKKK